MEQEKKLQIDEPLQLISFKVGEKEFGLNIPKVRGIKRTAQITKVNNAPDYVKGFVNLRGNSIPVIDLEAKLKMPKADVKKEKPIVVAELNNKTFGLIVDEVSDVLLIPNDIIETSPSENLDIDSVYTKAMGKLLNGLLMLVDLDKALDLADIEMLEAV